MKQYVYMGNEYPLKAMVDGAVKKPVITFDGSHFICKVPEPGEVDIAKALRKFYKKACRKVILERLNHYQPQIKIKYKDVTIEQNDKRWGSCSSRASLNFNYRLLMAPIEVIDYIVVHEMCHMDYMDHSKEYWHRVKEVMPEYLKYENWLKDNGKYLNFDYMESL